MRYIFANWKMHGTWAQLEDFIAGLSQRPIGSQKIVFVPPQIYLARVSGLLSGTELGLGAQNCFPGESLAITGETRVEQLLDCQVDWVLIGHSERRQNFAEDASLLASKCQAAYHAGLKTIYCVGEDLPAYQAGQTQAVLERQLSVLNALDAPPWAVAYEPTWAIGTQRAPGALEVETVLHWMAGQLRQVFGPRAQDIKLLYGGSVTQHTVGAYLQLASLAGVLCGSSSWHLASFLPLLEAANS